MPNFFARHKRYIYFSVFTAIAALTTFTFQNCAKSIDMNQYTGASATTTCSLPTSLVWTVGTAGCLSANAVNSIGNNSQYTVSADAPSTGSATFVCTNGVLSVATGATCDLSCQLPANLQWTVNGVTCTSPGNQPLANNKQVTLNAASPNTGSATYSCSNNKLSAATNATCTPPAVPGCTQPATFSWSVGAYTCTAPGGGSMAAGQVVNLTATPSATIGSATYTCTNQVLVLSNAVCTVSNLPAPPVITSPTTATTRAGCEGDPFSLAVTATGTGPISYQWYLDNAVITGATSATFSDYFMLNSHIYYVKVSNAGGTVQSVNMTVTGRSAATKACGGGIL